MGGSPVFVELRAKMRQIHALFAIFPYVSGIMFNRLPRKRCFGMKRRIALALACLVLLALPAMAETAAQSSAPKVSFSGKWVSIQGPAELGFEVFLPTAWKTDELSGDADGVAESYAPEQQITYAGNVYYAISGGHGVWGMTVGWTELDAAKDAAALQAEAVATYEDAAVVTINGVDFVRYTDPELDAIMLLLPEGNGVHEIALLPASDSDFTPWAEEIVTTVTVIEAAAD